MSMHTKPSRIAVKGLQRLWKAIRFPAERVKLERNPASEINIQLVYSSFPQLYSQDLAIEAEFPPPAVAVRYEETVMNRLAD